MINWIISNLATIIVGAIVFGVFIAIVISQIRKHKKGGGCGCGCSGCSMSGTCHQTDH